MKPPPDRWVMWAGVLPIIAVNAAYLVNIAAGSEGCFPYLEGCQSVSRGMRSGPGLWLFKIMALPSAMIMFIAWRAIQRSLPVTMPGSRPVPRAVAWLGLTSAAFFLVYAAWLGTEGDIYRWLRRYGVVFYFAGAGLAHLLLMSYLWRVRADCTQSRKRRYMDGYLLVVTITWVVGVASAFKRRLVDDPAFLDRLENALEWNFALFLSLSLVALAPLLRRA